MAGNRLTLTDRRMGRACTLLVAFTCFFYPLAACIIFYLNVPSTPINVGIRAMCAGGATFLIFVWTVRSRTVRLNLATWALLLFWLMYALRLIVDLNRGIQFSVYSEFTVYGFAFGNILLPIIAIALWAKHFDVFLFRRAVFFILIATNLGMLFALVSQSQDLNIVTMFSGGRAAIYSENNAADSRDIINPITISYYGSLLSISCFYLLLFKKTGIWRLAIIILFVIGVACLLLGGSRGPLVSWLGTLLLIFGYRAWHHREKVVLGLKTVLTGLIALLVLRFTVFRNFSVEDLFIYRRFLRFLETRSGTTSKREYRELAYESAWQDFLDSPVVGKQFVGTYDSFYPHNLILEVLMSTGLIGACLFFTFLILLLRRFFRIYTQRNVDNFFIAALLIPMFFGSLFSGSIFGSVDFWIIMSILAILPLRQKKRHPGPVSQLQTL